ncbi:MAG TPA: LLM class F420-dependent oxidoreductase [Pseudomonadales bacterium]|nr:LLM class F420-dependent oxidoreductase [Pseudomonadales bacterium]
MTTKPDFGVLIFPTDYAIDPATLASAVEARGFESLFVTEHTHIPVSRRSPWPGGAELPREYWHTHDPFVALSMAAAVTTTLKLGTGISLVTERDPILMAKQVATLDHLSGGRLVLGVGAGWNAEEMAHHGTPYAQRWKILRERILAMRTIWNEEEPEFHGEFVDFEPIWSWPKPARPGGPPILIGASSKYVFDRVAEYGDGWMPIDGRNDEVLNNGVTRLREACEAHGRDFAEMDLSVFGVRADAQRIEQLMAMGFRRLIFALPPADADTVIPLLDRYAEVAATFA